MKLERFYNSVIFRIFETLYKVIMLNLLFVLTIILGLGVFGYMIALIILVLGIKSFESEREYSIVKTWIINIKKHYKKAFKLSLFYTGVGLLMIFDTAFFYLMIQQDAPMVYSIIYYLFIAIDIVFLYAIVNAAFVFVYFPNLENRKIIKYSFKLFQLVPIQSIMLMVLTILTMILVYVFPLIVVFIWFSLVIYLYHTTIRNTYRKLVADGVQSLCMSEE